jgi:hypothetical protein
MEENRLVADSEQGKKEGRFERLDQKTPGEKPTAVWLKELSIPVAIYKQRRFERHKIPGNK